MYIYAHTHTHTHIYIYIYISGYPFLFRVSLLKSQQAPDISAHGGHPGAGWYPPPPTVLGRAQDRSLLRLGASAD